MWASSLASDASVEVWNDPAMTLKLEGVPDVLPTEILKFLQDTFRYKINK